ncbi:MAG: hypothetical protein NXY57DRAFT_1094073 [Lentinula lateritia]|nr:MAG: hypothetical protein NXY57DRAFT_1094073 [Lentinula lateritia]
MYSRSILCQLVAGVFCLFVSVCAIPVEPLKPRNSPKSSAPAVLHTRTPTETTRWEQWWAQLDEEHAPWLKIDLNSKDPEGDLKCEGYDKSSEVFADDLTQKILQRKSLVQNKGNNNFGIYTLLNKVSEFGSIPGDQIVVKLVEYEWKSASCEVFALRKYGDFQKEKGQAPTFVTSGFLKEPTFLKDGIIVMRKVPGIPLKDTEQWQNKAAGERQEILDKVFKNIQDFDYEFMEKTKFVHVDFTPDNFLVDENLNVHPIDFGAPSIYPVERVPTRRDFNTWFSERFDLLWRKYKLKTPKK